MSPDCQSPQAGDAGLNQPKPLFPISQITVLFNLDTAPELNRGRTT